MFCLLVIDDEEMILRLASETLGELGHDVLVAATGEDGVRKLRKYYSSVDLIFLDAKLPGMTGPEAIKELKIIRPDVPIIAMSGCPNGDVTEMMEHGALGFIAKPFSLKQLEQTICPILG